MYKYDKLKAHLNSSPTAYQFGKAVYINQSPDNLLKYSLIWSSDLGMSFRKQVIVSLHTSYKLSYTETRSFLQYTRRWHDKCLYSCKNGYI
jgi:hypothetical protein